MRTKSVDRILAQCEAGELHLKRSLTPLSLTALGVGGVIGAGIFVLTGHAAADYAGPAIVLSFILSGTGCAFAALCYAELASMIPVAGSAYTYAYASLGELAAWIIGWDLILEYLFGSATVAVGWSSYVASALRDLGIPFPEALLQAPYTFVHGAGWQPTGALVNLPALLICLVCMVLMVRGTRESTLFNNVVVTIKLLVICAFLVYGFHYVKAENLTPFIPENTGEFGKFGWSGIFRGAGVIFFAYVGFDALSTLAQESKDPQRTVPIGIIASLTIVTILYILVSFVMTGMVHYSKFAGSAAPIAVAIDAAGPELSWLRPLIKLGAIAGLSSVVLVLMLGQPRIFFAMAQDGLLPARLGRIHPKHNTPYIASYLTGALAAVVAGFLPIGVLGELVSIGTLLAFVIVCIGVLILRKTRPDLPRVFRTPGVPVVPILGIVVSLAQMIPLPLDTWLRLAVWLVVGLVVYFFYARKRSLVGQGA